MSSGPHWTRQKTIGKKTNVFLPMVRVRQVERRSAALASKKARQEICVMNGGNIMGFLPISYAPSPVNEAIEPWI